MNFMDVSVPAILQSSFSTCSEGLEPAVRRRATGVDPCPVGRFLPGIPCLHERHHLHFGCLVLFVFHSAFLPSLGVLAGLPCSKNNRPGLD
jgi:hypothetical protein